MADKEFKFVKDEKGHLAIKIIREEVKAPAAAPKKKVAKKLFSKKEE